MFNPLGSFDPNAPLALDALQAAREFKATLPAVPRGLLNRLYLHWAVEAFGCLDGAYNFEIDLEGGHWVMKMTHNPQDNAPGMNNHAEAWHTWHRNTGAIGIAIAGMDGASTHNFGADGVQMHELEYLCALAALCAVQYGIDTAGIVPAPGVTHVDNVGGNVNTTGEHVILTHGECAVIDSYPTERWDLGSLVSLTDGVSLTPEMRTLCGNALRERIHRYALVLKG